MKRGITQDYVHMGISQGLVHMIGVSKRCRSDGSERFQLHFGSV